MLRIIVTVWQVLLVLALPAGFIYGALTFGFFGALICALLAVIAVMMLPTVAIFAAVFMVLYALYLLVVLVAYPFVSLTSQSPVQTETGPLHVEESRQPVTDTNHLRLNVTGHRITESPSTRDFIALPGE
jgi:hypothetical protein